MARNEPSLLVDEAEAECLAQLAVIRDRRMGRGDDAVGFDKDMAMATAALMRALVSSEGERRQRDKAEARTLASFPLDQVVAYLRQLPEHQRQELAREISGADDREPLL